MLDKTKVFNCDCLPAMREYPDKYFELAIVDCPYGIDVNMNMGVRKGERRKHDHKEWDSSAPDETYFWELSRVSRNMILWGANHFLDRIPFYLNSAGWIFWDKLITGDVEFSAGELAWTSFDKSLKKFSHSIQTNYLTEPRIHPTQKPVALYKWLLKNYAKEGDKILDSHCGSSSSRIAAYDMGFEFVGYELDKDYFEAAEKRFNQHKAQLTILYEKVSKKQDIEDWDGIAW